MDNNLVSEATTANLELITSEMASAIETFANEAEASAQKQGKHVLFVEESLLNDIEKDKAFIYMGVSPTVFKLLRLFLKKNEETTN